MRSPGVSLYAICHKFRIRNQLSQAQEAFSTPMKKQTRCLAGVRWQCITSSFRANLGTIDNKYREGGANRFGIALRRFDDGLAVSRSLIVSATFKATMSPA